MPLMPPILSDLARRAPTALIVLVTVLLAMLVSGMLGRGIRRLSAGGHIPPGMAFRLNALRRGFIWTIAGLVVLQATGLFAQAWALASAMLAALAIGFFAAWSILSNATTTLIILALRPFRLGDRIELVEPSNGTTLGGRVVDLNLMYTTLDELDGNGSPVGQLRIPNNLMLQKLIRLRSDVEDEASTTPFFRDTLSGEHAPGTAEG